MTSELIAMAKSAVDVSKAAQVDGWMSGYELEWLGQKALEHLVIVELGSYLGRSTRALADNTLGKVYAVDDWMGADAGKYTRPLSGDQSIQMFEEFRVNVRDLIDAGIVVPIWIGREEAGILEVEPDMVFVDGDHSYEGAKRDIETWWPRLKDGGLLCGHDAGHPPLMQALREMFGGSHQQAKDTSIWFKFKGEEKA